MARTVSEAALLALKLLEKDEEGWISVDLDGTLAKYNGYKGATHIGEPVPAMAARVRRWVGRGKRVKIFTARADDEKSVNAIKKWLKDNELPDLEITNLKDKDCIEFWDDRAVAVEKNTGKIKEASNEPDSPYDIDSWLDEPEHWVYPPGFKAIDPDSDISHIFKQIGHGYAHTVHHIDPWHHGPIELKMGATVVPRHQAQEWLRATAQKWGQHGWRIEWL